MERRGWRKGTKHSEESRQRMKRTRSTDEYRQHMSDMLGGRPKSEEHREKLRAAALRRPKRPRKTKAEYHLRALKAGAVSREYEWALTDEWALQLIDSPCYYCGLPSVDGSNGIDRVLNDVGYTTENCVACCVMCNRSKHAYTQQEFFDWIRRVATHQRMIPASPA